MMLHTTSSFLVLEPETDEESRCLGELYVHLRDRGIAAWTHQPNGFEVPCVFVPMQLPPSPKAAP